MDFTPRATTFGFPLPAKLCYAGEGRELLRGDDAFGFGEGDGDELADAALGHGDAEEAIDARHGERVMGDDDKARVSQLAHFVHQVAEALDIGVIERRIHFVEYADG